MADPVDYVPGTHESMPTRRGSSAVSEPNLQPPDEPLIVEDLLLQAKRLADAGATIECIEKILERVAALREGRPDGRLPQPR